MTIATGIGSHPGDDQHAYEEALRIVLGELPDLPYLPEVPGRGAIATMTGRTAALVPELGFDLQPAGWRLTGGGSGVDHRRARSLLNQDLDSLEEQAAGFAGAFKTQIAGPWTLAASVEKPRGDLVLSDHGARRDLTQALAEGVTQHLAQLRRRLPDASQLVVQIDEPVLPAVMGGKVPTASGFGRHRSVDRPEASAALEVVFAAVTTAGGQPWLHSCAAGVDWALVRGAGAQGIAVDVAMLAAAELDVLAESLEAGTRVALGVIPGAGPASRSDKPIVEKVQRLLDMLGLDPREVGGHLVLTPSCGMAGMAHAETTQALRVLRSACVAIDQLG